LRSLRMGWLEQALEGAETRRIVIIATAIGVFALVQTLYGLKAGSLGLIADAIHMCFHCAALFVSLIGMLAASNRAAHVSFAYTYGYDRHEVLASFSNGLFLIFVALFIVAGAIGRLFQPALVEQSAFIFEFGIVGLAINILGLVLLGPGRSLEDHVKRYTTGQKLGAAGPGGGAVLPTHGGGGSRVSSAHASNVDAGAA
jgi:cation diffusion facilitator family transporter